MLHTLWMPSLVPLFCSVTHCRIRLVASVVSSSHARDEQQVATLGPCHCRADHEIGEAGGERHRIRVALCVFTQVDASTHECAYMREFPHTGGALEELLGELVLAHAAAAHGALELRQRLEPARIARAVPAPRLVRSIHRGFAAHRARRPAPLNLAARPGAASRPCLLPGDGSCCRRRPRAPRSRGQHGLLHAARRHEHVAAGTAAALLLLLLLLLLCGGAGPSRCRLLPRAAAGQQLLQLVRLPRRRPPLLLLLLLHKRLAPSTSERGWWCWACLPWPAMLPLLLLLLRLRLSNTENRTSLANQRVLLLLLLHSCTAGQAHRRLLALGPKRCHPRHPCVCPRSRPSCCC